MNSRPMAQEQLVTKQTQQDKRTYRRRDLQNLVMKSPLRQWIVEELVVDEWHCVLG